jgi:hypothetical protein
MEEITDRMGKIAHVPVKTWRRWNPSVLFGGWFSALGGFKTLIGVVALVLGTCLILPCLVSLVLQSVRTIMEATIERKTAIHVIMLWKYKPLNHEYSLTLNGRKGRHGRKLKLKETEPENAHVALRMK